MSYGDYAPPADPFAEPAPAVKKPKAPRARRCKECRLVVADDGYGEVVHAETGLYGEYEAGKLMHVAA